MPVEQKVLVTGAGGFIGSHLVQALLDKGASVRAFVKYNSRNDPGMLAELPKSALRSVEVLWGNICDPFAVRAAVRGCHSVFHLAALIGIPYSYLAPSDYVNVNIQGTLNVLQACREEGARLVHTSTSEVYGTAQYVPIDEKHPLQGQSPYSSSKIAADKLVESFHRSFGVQTVTVRPFNTFGPRQSFRALVPTVIGQALNLGRIKIGSLEPVRDLTYVVDTVAGMMEVGLSEEAVGQTVNLGVGRGESVGEIVHIILRVLGKEGIPIEHDPARVRPAASEVMRLVSDNRKAATLCGWRPRWTLEDGLAKTIDWFKSNPQSATENYVI